MNRLASAIAVVAVLLSPVRVKAEEVPSPPPPAASVPVAESPPPLAAPPQAEPTPVVESTPAPAAEEDPWALYERAFAAAVAAREDEVVATLSTLRSRFPHSGATALGMELLRHLDARRGGRVEPLDAGLRRSLDGVPLHEQRGVAPSAGGTRRYATLFEALHDEATSGAARAEFIVFHTLHGLAVGAELCVATGGCGNVAGALLFPMLTGGAGALGAVKFSEGGITPGHVLAINSGAVWGAWQAFALTGLTDNWSQGATPIFLIAAQAAGMVGGHFAWAGLGLSAGDVALMNTAGVWSGVYTLLTLAVSGVTGSAQGLYGVLLAASDVGLLVGGLLGRQFPMSRGRTLLLDAGAILGGLVGMGVFVLAVPNDLGRGLLGAALAGSGTGLAAAALLSRDWDASVLGPVQVGFAPTQHGGGQLLVSTRF